MALTLKALSLITDDNEPTEALRQLVSPTNEYGTELRKLILACYTFLDDPDFDLKNTTTDKIVEKFRATGASGSTITKGMAFFLAACKDANIEVSQYVKAPTTERSAAPKKKRRAKSLEIEDDRPPHQEDRSQEYEGKIKIPIPLHNMDDGVILLPEGMSKDQWAYTLKIAKFLLENYRPDFEAGEDDIE